MNQACTPSVAAIVVTRNRVQLVLRALRSILQQSVCPSKIIVVDNASTDGTQEAISALNDPRLRYLRMTSNLGAGPARNIGVEEAECEFVAFLDDDDTWHPDKVRQQLELFSRAGDDVCGVYTGIEMVSAHGRHRVVRATERGNIYAAVVAFNPIGTPSCVMLRKTFLVATGGFHTLLADEDWDLWIRLAAKYKFECLPDPLVTYYEHDDATSASAAIMETARNTLWRKYPDCLVSGHNKAIQYAKLGHLLIYRSKSRRGSNYLLMALYWRPWRLEYYAAVLLSLLGPSYYNNVFGVMGSVVAWFKLRNYLSQSPEANIKIRSPIAIQQNRATVRFDNLLERNRLHDNIILNITAVIVTRNRCALLKCAIESVIRQSLPAAEIIIVDNASTDGTRATVTSFDDPRILYVYLEQNAGCNAARNLAVSRATTDYVAFLDDDDEWDQFKLEAQAAVMQGAGEIVCGVYTGLKIVDELGRIRYSRPRERGNIYPAMLAYNPVGTVSSVLLRRGCFQKVGGFFDMRASGDWDLWIRLSKEYEFEYVAHPLVLYREHAVSITGTSEALIAGRKTLWQRNPECISSRWRKAMHFLKLGHVLVHRAGDRRGALLFVKAFCLVPWHLEFLVGGCVAACGTKVYRSIFRTLFCKAGPSNWLLWRRSL